MAVTASKTMTIPPVTQPGEYFEVTFGPFSDDANAAGMAAILLTGAHDVFPLPFGTSERLLLTKVWATSTTVSSVAVSTANVGLIRKSNGQAVPSGAQLTSLNDNRICSGGTVGIQTTGTPPTKADGTTAIPIIVASSVRWTELEVEGHANIIEPNDHLYIYSEAVPTALEGLLIRCRFRRLPPAVN